MLCVCPGHVESFVQVKHSHTFLISNHCGMTPYKIRNDIQRLWIYIYIRYIHIFYIGGTWSASCSWCLWWTMSAGQHCKETVTLRLLSQNHSYTIVFSTLGSNADSMVLAKDRTDVWKSLLLWLFSTFNLYSLLAFFMSMCVQCLLYAMIKNHTWGCK